MRSFYQSKYEASLDELITKHGTKPLSRELVACLKTIYNEEEAVKFTDRAEEIKMRVDDSKGVLKLHISGLKSLINSTVIHQLDDEIKNDQAVIIYKYLFNAYTLEPADLPEVVEGIARIRDEKIFPVDDIKRSSFDGKYRALSNLFVDTEVEPSKHKLKFGMAILGIIPEALNKRILGEEDDDDLDQIEELSSESNKKSESGPREESASVPSEESGSARRKDREQEKKIMVGTVGVLLAIVLVIVYFFSVAPSPTSNDQIEASKLLTSTYQLEKSDAQADSLMFSLKEGIAISKDTYLIKFSISNLSNQVYYLDRVTISFDGTIISLKERTQYQLPEDLVEIQLDNDSAAKSIIVLNSSPSDGIAARSEAAGFVLVRFSNSLSFEVIPKLVIEAHNKDRDIEITANSNGVF